VRAHAANLRRDIVVNEFEEDEIRFMSKAAADEKIASTQTV